MHPHLHTKDNSACEDLMNALEECHDRGFIWKSIGGCNGEKEALSKCLRAERVKRQAKNRDAAQEKKERIQAAWRDIEENS